MSVECCRAAVAANSSVEGTLMLDKGENVRYTYN